MAITSDIDPNAFPDYRAVRKSDLRNQFSVTKAELEALMRNNGLFLPTAAPDVARAEDLQDIIEQANTTGNFVRIGQGTVLVDKVVAKRSTPPGNSSIDIFGFSDGTASGLSTIIEGMHRELTFIEAAIDGNIFFRYNASDWPATRALLALRHITFKVGVITSARPLVSVGGNLELDISYVGTEGHYDLTRGGGITGLGQFGGSIRFCRIRASAGPGINLGGGTGPGVPINANNHPYLMSIEDNIVEDSASHAANLHANWSGSIARNKFIHDTGRLGYLKSNTGVRGGNGGQGVRWIDNDVDGYYRGLQMNDVLDAVISGNRVNRSGAASLVYGAKNSGSAGNAVITGNTFRDAGRLRGRPKPEADAGEEDDVNLINESGHIVLSGGENVSISGNSYENDHRRIALGKLTVTLGATSGVLVDAVPQGNNLTGLSNNYPGDMLYTLGNTNSPSFFARIATGGISARDFMSNTDGTGVVLATTAYLDTPLTRMQESYVKATITSIVQGTTTTVNVSGSPDIKTGDHVVFLGGDMTEIIEMTAEATKINANQFTVPINSTTFTPYTTGGEVIRGAAAVKQTISFDAPSMAALTDEAFRIRVLEMDYIQTGVAKWAPTGTGTMKWVPTRDPMYFIPGPTGATINTDPASTTVEGFGSPSFIQTIKAPLDDLSHVLLLTDEGGGIHRTIGRITSVTDDDTIVLTANALRDYTGAYVYTIENKVRFGCGIIGDQDTVENRARRVQINWLDGEVGGSLASWHIFPDTLSFTDMAKEKFLTSALTLGTGENIEYTAGVIHLKRQRLDDVRIKFGGPVTGDAANYVKCRIRRLRQESGVAVWRTIGAATTPMDVELTQSARLAGDTINITAPRHVNGSMNANDLFDSREADLLVVELYAVGTGSDVPPLEILVPELPW